MGVGVTFECGVVQDLEILYVIMMTPIFLRASLRSTPASNNKGEKMLTLNVCVAYSDNSGVFQHTQIGNNLIDHQDRPSTYVCN